ncbi:esterase/lipase family protein [Psychrobacter lutiphocae]|uniref:esterase/lipase family protein n=1 Tax=Psychrobacter lutiphocae TaxID=540500 RepID=UPI000381868F|nr:hypothetical protein [Psychrobacter lutiphocae]
MSIAMSPLFKLASKSAAKSKVQTATINASTVADQLRYRYYEKCDLITPASPVFLTNLYENLDHLDNLDDSVFESEFNSEMVGCESMQDAQPLSLSNFFEGLAQLTTTGAVETTEIVEAIHSEIILRPLGRFNEDHLTRWQQGLIRKAYNVLRKGMNQVGNGLTQAGVALYRKSLKKQDRRILPEKLKLLANVLNGMLGDHLVSRNNPLAVSMMLYGRYGQPQRTEICGRVVILLHGLCLSYLSWHPTEDNSLGEKIALAQPASTVLYLDYNTGRRISENGHCLNRLLQELVTHNPDISQIDLVGYSMGGLVARSALFYAELQSRDWVNRVGNLITLGSPHQGAGLERISHLILDIVGKVPFAGSLSKLGNIRSAGIIDLRHGSIRDADWKYLGSRDVLPEEFRHPARLPKHVHTFLIAGTIAEGIYASKASTWVGDGLVTIESALGESDGEHNLYVPDGHKAVFYGVNHLNLQYDSRVHAQVLAWLVDNGKTDFALNNRIQSFADDDIDVVV